MKKLNCTLLLACTCLLFSNTKVIAQASKIQIVHNSPDFIIDTVDVWLNNTKFVNDLAFRHATSMLSIDSGDYILTIAKKFSTDTTASFSLFKSNSFRIDTAKTYLSFISGVIDTNQYSTNPNGIDRSFSLTTTDAYSSSTSSGQVELSFINGVPDASSLDLNEIGLPGLIKIADDFPYNVFSNSSVSLSTGNTLFNITNSDSTLFKGAYRMNSSFASGQRGIIFTSGINESIGNPSSAKQFAVFVAFSNGTVRELVKLVSQVQLIHNSADVTIDTIDVYLNGKKVIDNFGFRDATPFVKYNALVPTSIAFAAKNSISADSSFYSTSIVFDSSSNYYALANGVLNTSNYIANPNAKNISFKIHTYKGAKEVADISKNIELLYFHGVTDMTRTTSRGSSQVQFLSKNDAYGEFHGYSLQSAQDNLLFDLLDASNDTIITSGISNLINYHGKAGIVFASGFASANSLTNQNGDTAILFIAWPDGNIDSIAPIRITTGFDEKNIEPSDILVYPNPANSYVNIKLTINLTETITTTITDIRGKVISTNEINVSSGANNISINSENIESGIYFLTITSNSNSITKKFNVLK
jgi:hypothetical protein